MGIALAQFDLVRNHDPEDWWIAKLQVVCFSLHLSSLGKSQIWARTSSHMGASDAHIFASPTQGLCGIVEEQP